MKNSLEELKNRLDTANKRSANKKYPLKHKKVKASEEKNQNAEFKI